MKKENTFKIINILIVIIVIGLGTSFIFAWNEPTVHPTVGNVPAPINVSNNPQGIGGENTGPALLKVHGTLSSKGLAVWQPSLVSGGVYLTNFSGSQTGICADQSTGNVILCDAPPTSFAVTINKEGTGAPSSYIASVPGNPTCDSTSCTITATGPVTLSANPGEGYVFNGWSNGCSGNSTCTLSNTATVTATFGNAAIPTVTTNAVTQITGPTALGGGTITSNGGSNVTVSGLVWGTSPNPTTALSTKTTDGQHNNSPWSSAMSGLTLGQNYYVRAYAMNAVGTGYGIPEQQFNASTVPSVTTSSVTPGSTSATTGGNVTNGGGTNVTARGVAWSTFPYPTIGGSHTSDGVGSGVFTSTITGLSISTTYHVRAYATNSNGTTYGDDISFTTTANCAGTVKHGYCWYSAAYGQNCTTTCASHGGCVNASLTFNEESDVCVALWSSGSVGSIGVGTAPIGNNSGQCQVQGYPSAPTTKHTETTCNNTYNQWWRNACSCNN